MTMSMNHNDDDPYEVLGIPQDATPSQIRSAYRKLALRHHPDKQKTPEAKEEANLSFSRISHAYEIVSDPNRRREYDYQAAQNYAYYNPQPFHDPFQVFAHVFGQEFGAAPMSSSMDPMMDGFAGDPFFGGNMFGGSLFGGGMLGGGDMFSQMQRQMDMMHQGMFQQQQQNGMPPMNGQQSYYYSSSSSNSNFASGGARESVTTSTRIVNGKRQTITERTVVQPDGSVERHVESSGDDDFPQEHRPQLDYANERPQLPQDPPRSS